MERNFVNLKKNRNFLLIKLLLTLSVILFNLGLLFRWFHWKAEESCSKVRDQCADAGFAWEASGSFLILISLILLMVVFISYVFMNENYENYNYRSS